MIKKKAKSKKTAKKTARKPSTRRNKKELNLAEVRKNITEMIEAEAEELAGAVIEEGKKGQLPTVKYLFEVAHIHPEPAEPTTSSAEEDSLAKTLLDGLNIPQHPVVHDLYESGEDVVIIPARAAEKVESSEEKKEEELVGAE